MKFGLHDIPRDDVFAASRLSFAFVNLKPLVPGHVLISPQRVVARFGDMTPDEAGDLWQLAHRLTGFLEKHFSADSLSLVIQDGPAAGQTVGHVHIHCLPRHFEDIENNDEIYDMIDEAERGASAELHRRGKRLGDLDQERIVKTPEEMAAEAAALREGLDEWMTVQT
eukprot:TRINITY_DN19524_c0_g1_i2.p1 TRINITY_DN19524_c0_g1~~TRINITY_DN19524_c0_g1_i2.p1  ORF type:complete len:168 (-),score=29.11 TRINITY_DN19524_c0_g1_i2:436-939(-)